MEKIESKNLDIQFKSDVAAHPGGDNIKLCFACGTCTAGCPVSAIDPEYNPRKIIREVLLGMRKEVLSSPVIWRCVQCYACYAKCPQNVKFRDVMRAIRELAVEEGYVPADVSEEVARLDDLSQKMRRGMVQTLLTDRRKYDAMKAKVQEVVGV